MNAFVFNAALWCPDCIKEVFKRLDAEGKRPSDPEDENTFDSDYYPKGPFMDGGGESDCIQVCDGCHCLLENPLTDYGLSDSRKMLLDNLGRPSKHINHAFWSEALDYYPEIMEHTTDWIREKLTDPDCDPDRK